MSVKILTLLLSVTQLWGLTLGTAINITEAPWQASVLVNDKHRCGGAIYSENVILTTAQCVNRVNVEKLAVRVGSDKKDLGGQVVSVKKVSTQVLGSRASDVAILILKEPIELDDDTVQSIELASRSPRVGTKATVTGWAEVVGADPPQEILMSANLTIVDKKRCGGGGFIIKPLLTMDELCVSKSSSNNLICQGFSGGPLVADGKLIGIGAWNTNCDFLQSPSVFANIPNLKIWITGATKLINIFHS